MDIKKFKIKNNFVKRKKHMRTILAAIGCYSTSPIVSTIVFTMSMDKNNKLVAFHSFQSAIVYLTLHTLRSVFLCVNKITFKYLFINSSLSLILNLLTISEVFFTVYGVFMLYKGEVFGFKKILNFFKKLNKA